MPSGFYAMELETVVTSCLPNLPFRKAVMPGQLGASVAALRELAAMCGLGKHNMNHRGHWRP